MAAEDTTPELVAPQPIKKKKSLKRLKGLITGKSRREKRKAKAAAAALKNVDCENGSFRSMDIPDDGSTVYGAELDNASVMDKSTSSTTVKSTVIADPVQIILLIMDPETRRFELLQLEFDSSMAKVSDIFKQIPVAATEEVLQKTSYSAIISAKGEKLDPNSDLSYYFTGAGVVVAVPESSADNLEKCASMAIPILTNSKVNNMLLTAGIRPEDLPEKPVKKARVVPPSPIAEKVETESGEPLKLAVVMEEKQEKATEKVKQDSTNYFFTGILVAVFVHLFIKAHLFISAPLHPGSTLAPGQYKDSCGLLGSVPFYSCSAKKVIMGTDGILTIMDGDKVAASFIGGQSNGVVIKDDGSLLIGGQKAKAKVKPTASLSPFPFSEEVVFKTGRF